MKRILSVLIIMSFFACQKEQDVFVDGFSDVTKAPTAIDSGTEKYNVSISDAKRYSDLRYPDAEYSLTPYVVGRDTLMYIFNYDEGWMVVSGDRRVTPVIAVSLEGALDMNEKKEFVFYLQTIAEDIASIKKDDSFVDKDMVQLWDRISPTRYFGQKTSIQTKAYEPRWVVRTFMISDYSSWTTDVDHLIDTKWGQGYPWNQKLPRDSRTPQSFDPYELVYDHERCVTGCVSVAIAQVLFYLHHTFGFPTHLYQSIQCSYPSVFSPASDVGFSRGWYVDDSDYWDYMQSESNPYGNCVYVGDLMLDIGNRFGMEYGGPSAGGSGTVLYNHYSALSYYDITCSVSNHSVSTVRANLLNGLPVIVTADNSDDTRSHAWIIDGIITEAHQYYYVRMVEYTYDWTEEDETYTDFSEIQRRYGFQVGQTVQYFQESGPSVYLYYMNWGEDGDGDNTALYASSSWYYNSQSVFSKNKRIYYGFTEL